MTETHIIMLMLLFSQIGIFGLYRVITSQHQELIELFDAALTMVGEALEERE